MEFEGDAKLYSSLVQREGGEDVLYFNYRNSPEFPSLAGSARVMEMTINSLIENSNVSRIVFVGDKNYNYDFKETNFLLEIASLYVFLMKQDQILSHDKLVSISDEFFKKRYNDLLEFLNLLKSDPLASYSTLKRILVETKIAYEKTSGSMKVDFGNYLKHLEKIMVLFQKTKLIQEALPYLEGYKKGERGIYERLFSPDVIPNFTFTRLVEDLPREADIVDQYEISLQEYDQSVVTILRKKGESKLLYHLNPPENSLSDEESSLLNLARGVLIEHQPKAEEFTDTERTRQVFFNISKDLIRDLASTKNISMDFNRLNKLATILVRHTIGFGLIEVLLQDRHLQDISLNAPISQTPVYVRHQSFDE
jgi:hypothetical protein